MAPCHCQLRTPLITLSENVFQALMDPPNDRTDIPDDRGHEFLAGMYEDTVTNVLQTSVLLWETAQHFAFFADTFRYFLPYPS
jgi:hypothetical protein